MTSTDFNLTDTPQEWNIRTCRSCGESKPLDDFPNDKGTPGGKRWHCKKCRNARRSLWRLEHQSRQTENVRKWRHRNLDRAKAEKAWRDNNKEKVRNYRRKFFTGIPLGEYDRKFAEQNGRCAICQREGPVGNRPLGVDHCHVTGKIRSLLCNPCNAALGNMEDDAERLQKAIAYLLAWS